MFQAMHRGVLVLIPHTPVLLLIQLRYSELHNYSELCGFRLGNNPVSRILISFFILDSALTHTSNILHAI